MMLAKLVIHPYLLGVLLPFLVYKVYALTSVAKTYFTASPDFTHLPKYKLLVFKIHRLLTYLLPYYQNLSKDGKRRFISRVIHLLPQKKFIARDGAKVTLEKQIVILSALVQLTFGLKSFAVRRFSRIILYPKVFYSRLIERHVKGLTVGTGNVLLSWYDTFKGMHHPSDNYNLALHEWAHAFQLNHKMDDVGWVYFRLENHMQTIDPFYRRIKKIKDEKHYLRAYAFTNVEEFFAVCVEHFFETPQAFIKEEPELYNKLCKLLNQDPLNHTKDYKLE
jgi:Mlc titration factor MtfA (ptsG expression regulator)